MSTITLHPSDAAPFPARGPDEDVAVRGLATGARWVLRADGLIGAGGEARVFALPDDAARVAKLYHHPDAARRAKTEAMLLHPPAGAADGGHGFAWPEELLVDETSGAFAGIVMPRAEGPRAFELYNPVTRRQRAPLFHHGLLHRAARNVARAFARLHEAGYVVGDVNESNLLVGADGGVTLVDADSFQVRDPRTGAVHRSRVGKAEFTPPELQGVSFEEVDRAPEHDRFGLAVVLFHLLMEGTHPFAGRYDGKGEPPPLETRIRRGHFPHAERPGLPLRPPRLAPPFGTLHPTLRALFVRCFADGHEDPAARPAADEWARALEEAEGALVECRANRQHRFGTHLAACPWCERTARLAGRDPFPAPGARAVPLRLKVPKAVPEAGARGAAASRASTRPAVPRRVGAAKTAAPAPAPAAPVAAPPPAAHPPRPVPRSWGRRHGKTAPAAPPSSRWAPPGWLPPGVSANAHWLAVLLMGVVDVVGATPVAAPLAALAVGLGGVGLERVLRDPDLPPRLLVARGFAAALLVFLAAIAVGRSGWEPW